MRRPNSSRFALVARAVQFGLVLVGAFALTASGQQHSNKANFELADNSRRRTCGRACIRAP
jgi:hypothetical protein